ncbi:MAG: AAA family ATPase [Clostridia bacterium]|nr:AAA family ATPase [Clostridia bacterium]
MIYLESFTFPDAERDNAFVSGIVRTCYDSYYPFGILSARSLEHIDFEQITILYGGNGSGKTTALNVIAEKTQVQRESIYNKSNFFPDYVKLCEAYVRRDIPANSHIITSDDVFDYMLNVRSINQGVDNKREELFEEYLHMKFGEYAKHFQMRTMADYEQLKRVNKARSKTQSRFVRGEMPGNVREFSNGESAFKYFVEKIEENGLYILDEPENSLSPARQIELAQFIEDSARFFGCQFVISTHSPFMLAMQGARVYDLDAEPVCVKPWTELEIVRIYHEFFAAHKNEF